MVFVPIITGEPISSTILTIGSLLGGIFGGKLLGSQGNIKQAFEGLRQALKDTASVLQNAASRIARALNPIWGMLKRLWQDILKPLLKWFEHIAERIKAIYDKILKPYLDTINKVRKMILDVYEKYIRPVVVIIDRVRRVLAVLRLAHIHIADDLDKLLLKLENKLTQPIFIALQKINELGGWFNVLLRVDMILQETIFSRSLWQWKKDVAGYGLRAIIPPATDRPTGPTVTVGQSVQNARQYLRTDAGPNAEAATIARQAFDSVAA